MFERHLKLYGGGVWGNVESTEGSRDEKCIGMLALAGGSSCRSKAAAAGAAQCAGTRVGESG
jgi:hypothetical protein